MSYIVWKKRRIFRQDMKIGEILEAAKSDWQIWNKERKEQSIGRKEEQMVGKGEEQGIGRKEEQMVGKGEEQGTGRKEEQMVGKGEEQGTGRKKEQSAGKGEEQGIGRKEEQMVGKGEEQGTGKGKAYRIAKWKEKEKIQTVGKLIPTALCLCAIFFLGRSIAGNAEKFQLSDFGNKESKSAAELLNTQDAAANGGTILTSENWGLGFGAEGSKPTGNASPSELAKYNAYFVSDTNEKIIYLTFDCGYENGNTAPILDALKKHNVKATFFVVGHYLESAPDLTKRMVEEGHTVGNHTYHHPDMSKISDQAAFQKEMDDVRTKFQEITGTELSMYYRPPQGKYSTNNLQMAKDMGYSTFFWSLAYVDWNVDAQPSREEAIKKLTGRIHPGAIVLLHSTSKTNAEIMDEILTKWEEMGYTFGTLDAFVAKAAH